MPHIHDAIDFTVAAFIIHNGRVLLVNHRKLHKWLPVGGHIELDEDPEQALYREIAEESGLPRHALTLAIAAPALVSEGTKVLPAPSYLDIHAITGSHRHIGMIYFLRSETSDVRLAAGEHDGIEWLSPNDLDSPVYALSPAIKWYASQALAAFP